jgi:hypothetical protein
MKNFLLAGAVAVFMAASASATVTYGTSGTFDCTNGSFLDGVSGTDTVSGCGTDSVTLNDPAGNEAITLLFNNIAAATVNATNETLASYGNIQASCLGAGCVSGATLITLTPGILSLGVLISETAPDTSPGNSAGLAELTGGFAFDSSSLVIGAYSGSPVTVTGKTDTVVYTMDTSDSVFSPSSGVNTPLGMRITDDNVVAAGVPEPGTLATMGLGLLMVGMISRRKRT